MNILLIERMYWQHGYSELEIVDRLRADPRVVSYIANKNTVETKLWNEDTGTYSIEQTPRTRSMVRKTPLLKNKDEDKVIFPDRPKRIDFTRASTDETVDTVQTPLRCLAETVELNGVSAANWRIGAKDPAAVSKIDWLAKDAWEFYLLCVCMIAWCAYRLGVHRGAW